MSYEPTKWSMRRFGATQKIKHLNYDVKNLFEKGLRKALFLAPDTSMDWIGEGGLVDSEKLSASIEHSVSRFHGQPRREYYLDKFIRFFFYNWYEPLFKFKHRMRSKLEWFLFFRARELTWKTHHYITKSGTDHIDGYFEYKVWGIKCGRTFDLSSISGIQHEAWEWDTKTKKNKKILNYIDMNKYGSWGFPTLVVLKKKIMPKDIDKILNKWYDDQVEYKYRHWTHKGDRPNIIVDELYFDEDLCKECGHDMVREGKYKCACKKG